MLNSRIVSDRVLFCDFTGVYGRQGISEGRDMICFSDLSGTGMYVDKEAEEEIKRRLLAAGFPGKYRIRFLDNGNYHYMTRILASFSEAPFDLITFDNHTDDKPPAFEGLKSCGSWRLDIAAENKNLQNSMLIQSWQDFESVYISSDLPLYISLDKDILSRRVLETNWDQGNMTEEELFRILEELFKTREIEAFDICGEDLPDKSQEANREFNLRLLERSIRGMICDLP